MTGKPKPIDPWPVQDTRKPDAKPEPGLTKEIVNELYGYVLSGGTGARTTAGQFKKGASGNPKGRPKRDELPQVIPPTQLPADSTSAIALRQGARKIKAQTEHGEVELTLIEATITRMVREALKGNTGHSRTFLQIVSRAEAEEAKRRRDVFRYWSAVKEQARQLYLDAEQAGEEPPLSVHPGDIEIHADGTVAIIGPKTAEDIAVMRYIHSMVDYHIVNIAYHLWIERRATRLRGRRVEGCLYAELDFWNQQDDLPPRLKMTFEEVTERVQSYARFSGRTLHGFLRAKAERLGLHVPPREARAPLIVPKQVLEFAKENNISLRQLLPMWLEAESKLMNARIDGLRAPSRIDPKADIGGTRR